MFIQYRITCITYILRSSEISRESPLKRSNIIALMIRTLLKVLSSLGGHILIMAIVVTSINNSITWIFARHCPYYPYISIDSSCVCLQTVII